MVAFYKNNKKIGLIKNNVVKPFSYAFIYLRKIFIIKNVKIDIRDKMTILN